MLESCGGDINPCGVDTGMPENIGQLGDILFDAVKGSGEQMAQVMGEDLLRRDLCLLAKCFHLPPDIMAADGFSVSRYKHRA